MNWDIEVTIPPDNYDLEIEVENEAYDFNIEFENSVAVNTSEETMTVNAGENISSSNVIMIVGGLAYKYQPSDQANYGKAVGIATNAALTGSPVVIKLSGKVNVTGWGLSADALYYATDNGAITTTPPSSGLLNLIGIATDTDNLIIDIDEPIILN